MTTATGPERQAPISEPVPSSGYDSEPENWFSRGLGIFLGLGVSLAAVAGVVSLLLKHHLP